MNPAPSLYSFRNFTKVGIAQICLIKIYKLEVKIKNTLNKGRVLNRREGAG